MKVDRRSLFGMIAGLPLLKIAPAVTGPVWTSGYAAWLPNGASWGKYVEGLHHAGAGIEIEIRNKR